jgi:hypothetical protein
LAAGQYRLVVTSGAATQWQTLEIELSAASGPIQIRVPILSLRGEIKLGGKPLQATVVFGGRSGEIRIRFQSDEEGRFSGFLPREAPTSEGWPIYVEAASPLVRRILQRVKVTGDSTSDTAEVSIDLPVSGIRGLILDAKSRQRVARPGIVTIRREQDPPVQLETTAEDRGAFLLEGLDPGEYVMSAALKGGLLSGQVRVTVSDRDGDGPPTAELLVLEEVSVKGQVVSADEGIGIPGARIKVVPRESPLLGVHVSITDADGRFDAHLQSGTTHAYVVVSANGYAHKIATAQISSDGSLTVPLDRVGGTLILKLNERPGRDLFILGGGYVESLGFLLAQWALPNGGGLSEGQAVIPQMASGAYAVCRAGLLELEALMAQMSLGTLQRPNCTGGTLSLGGELTLQVPPSQERPKETGR